MWVAFGQIPPPIPRKITEHYQRVQVVRAGVVFHWLPGPTNSGGGRVQRKCLSVSYVHGLIDSFDPVGVHDAVPSVGKDP